MDVTNRGRAAWFGGSVGTFTWDQKSVRAGIEMGLV
jgi:hypothetical protein